MKVKFSILFWMLVLVAASFGLYMVKYRVQHIKRELAQVEQQIAQQQEALHIANAEWAYLNRPERLHELAARHLKLVPMAGAQMMELADLPKAGQQEQLPSHIANILPASATFTVAQPGDAGDALHDE